MEDSGVLVNVLKPAFQRKKWEAGLQYLLTSIVQILPSYLISSYQQDIINQLIKLKTQQSAFKSQYKLASAPLGLQQRSTFF